MRQGLQNGISFNFLLFFNIELWLLLENKSFISLSMLDLGWTTVESFTSHRQLTTAQCLLCMCWEFYELLGISNFALFE